MDSSQRSGPDLDLSDGDRISVLRWQLRMTWSLALEWHLPHLTDQISLWSPAEASWTVRLGEDGIWRTDWEDPEPANLPPPSVGWLTWHVIWWWSEAIAHVRGESVTPREEVCWPGSADAAVTRIRQLAGDWQQILTGASDQSLDRPLRYPWPQPRPLAFTVGWVNAELMKNVAEIGLVRNFFEHRHR